MESFNNASYLSQVRRLRKQAFEALRSYDLDNYDLEFINHGENATFRVRTKKQDYLLRLHRNNYHSKSAIKEELNWLSKLSKSDSLFVQSPIKNRKGTLIDLAKVGYAPDRYFDLLTWQPGSIRFKSLGPNSFYKIGRLTAELHNRSTQKIKHRVYWDISGLLGKNATFGSLESLKIKVTSSEYKLLDAMRKKIVAKMNRYAKKYPNQQGLIHADLHFGNLIWNKGEVAPIDFDDCGQGLFMYDLAVTLHGPILYFSEEKRRRYIDKYIAGYRSTRDLSIADLEMVSYLIVARDIVMLCWLNLRSDNPKLKRVFQRELSNTIKRVKVVLKNGPDRFY